MAPGHSETPDPPTLHRPSASEPPNLVQVTRRLEHRTVALFLVVVGALVFAYGWLQPEVTDPGQRRLAYLGLAGLLGLVVAAGLGLMRPAILHVRRSLRRREASYGDLVEEVEDRARRLEQRNQDLRRFAYIVAHDLREPARTVTTHARLVAREVGEDLPGQAREDLEMAAQAARRLDDLLADLLTYTTLEQDGTQPQPVDANEALEEAIHGLSARLDASTVTVEAGDLPTVEAEPGHLVMLFEHLLSNAVKFGPENDQTRIEVTSQRSEEACTIEVQDNGIGMDPDYTDRIFSIFERLHAWEEYGGTGVGLALCQRIVERHGGEITVDSQPGEGSRFRFTLPLAQEPEDPAGPRDVEAGARFEELV